MTRFLNVPLTPPSTPTGTLQEPTKSVIAKVYTVLPAFQQVRLRCPDGVHYAITQNTPGIDWERLREGQEVECLVTTTHLPRVLQARRLADEA